MSSNISRNNSNSIINDTIKIVYRGDDGKTIKNAILSKPHCSHYQELELKKTKTNGTSNGTTNGAKFLNVSRHHLMTSKRPVVSLMT